MKKFFFVFIPVFLVVIVLGGFLIIKNPNRKFPLLSPISNQKTVEEKVEEYPLKKYQFQQLKKRLPQISEIKKEKLLFPNNNFNSYLFSYQSENRKITGLMNLPNVVNKNKLPVVLMLRGWVDPAQYQTGIGTQRAGEVFAENGYLTFAPDYLGYGESDMPPNDVWEERFLRIVTVVDLLESIKKFDRVDPNRIFVWAHSNGGLTALQLLELTGESLPTTLWAPVSQFFPYDVLYYTFEFDDKGKTLRKNLAELEEKYDINNFSYDEFLDWIDAPVQIHQGLNDPYIPVWWSDKLAEQLEQVENQVNYYKYPGAGHNMEGSWDLVVRRDLLFFNEHH